MTCRQNRRNLTVETARPPGFSAGALRRLLQNVHDPVGQSPDRMAWLTVFAFISGKTVGRPESFIYFCRIIIQS
jgi:hypothetical protein